MGQELNLKLRFLEVQVVETEQRLILLPGKRKSNENAASASVFKEYQLSGLRQAFQGTL